MVDDSIEFHGAKVSVDVHNSYRSRLFRRSKLDLNVAAERSVRVKENGVECSLDTHLLTFTLRKHKCGERPSYGAFVWEFAAARAEAVADPDRIPERRRTRRRDDFSVALIRCREARRAA